MITKTIRTRVLT